MLYEFLKTSGFLTFSEGIEIEHWLKIDQYLSVHENHKNEQQNYN